MQPDAMHKMLQELYQRLVQDEQILGKEGGHFYIQPWLQEHFPNMNEPLREIDNYLWNCPNARDPIKRTETKVVKYSFWVGYYAELISDISKIMEEILAPNRIDPRLAANPDDKEKLIDILIELDNAGSYESRQIGRKKLARWNRKIGHPLIDSLLEEKRFPDNVLVRNWMVELEKESDVSLAGSDPEKRNGHSMQIFPAFGIPSGRLSTDVFVLMPFHESFSPIFYDHIAKVCKSIGFEVKRADDIFGSSAIIDDIWELIANSKIIIADCSGKNPNVFYELGIAHTLGKKVIIITQSANDIPFDIRHIRYIQYEYTPRGMKIFETTLKRFIKEGIKKDD